MTTRSTAEAKALEPKPLHVKPVFYAHILDDLKRIAKEYGYNLTLHGSMNRDIDIICFPWADEVKPHFNMVEAIREHLGGQFNVANNAGELVAKRKHGRYGYLINLNRDTKEYTQDDPEWYLDIAVFPGEIVLQPGTGGAETGEGLYKFVKIAAGEPVGTGSLVCYMQPNVRAMVRELAFGPGGKAPHEFWKLVLIDSPAPASIPETNWEKELELALITVTRLAKEKQELKEEIAALSAPASIGEEREQFIRDYFNHHHRLPMGELNAAKEWMRSNFPVTFTEQSEQMYSEAQVREAICTYLSGVEGERILEAIMSRINQFKK